MERRKILKCRFSRGDSHMNVENEDLDMREYDYFFIPENQVVKKGDYAIVRVGNILKIVKVMGVGFYSAKATKHAIAVFSLEAHLQRMEREEKIKVLYHEIQQRAERALEKERLRQLAEADEQLAKMLHDLQVLESQT